MDYQNHLITILISTLENRRFPLLKVSTNESGGDCVLPHLSKLEHIKTGYKDWMPLNYKSVS